MDPHEVDSISKKMGITDQTLSPLVNLQDWIHLVNYLNCAPPFHTLREMGNFRRLAWILCLKF